MTLNFPETVSVPRRRGRKAKKTILEEYGEEREKILDRLGGSKAAPFPRDAVQEALVLDARDRAAAKKRALVEDVPPPPVFDPFEDNLVRASVCVAAMASHFHQHRTRHPHLLHRHRYDSRDPRNRP